jgi:hypothetical protein
MPTMLVLSLRLKGTFPRSGTITSSREIGRPQSIMRKLIWVWTGGS